VDCTHNNKTARCQRKWPQRLMHGADSPREISTKRQQTSSKVSQSQNWTRKWGRSSKRFDRPTVSSSNLWTMIHLSGHLRANHQVFDCRCIPFCTPSCCNTALVQLIGNSFEGHKAFLP
jgi:hypothetical protein